MTGTCKVGMRVMCLVLSVLSLLCVAQPVAAVPAAETATQTMTTLVCNKSGFVIGQMENGTKLNILGENSNTYRVDCYDMKGYILKSQVECVDGEYYVNCKEGSAHTKKITYTAYEDVLTRRKDIYKLAKKQLGSRYAYGSARPGAFDCSGFTSYVMKKNNISVHRTASTQLQDGVVIPTEALQVGDLVFFKESGSKFAATHVGIYVGDNKMIHSARHGVVVESMDSPYYAKYYLCARRVLHPSPIESIQPVQTRSLGPALTTNSITGRTAQCCD